MVDEPGAAFSDPWAWARQPEEAPSRDLGGLRVAILAIGPHAVGSRAAVALAGVEIRVIRVPQLATIADSLWAVREQVPTDVDWLWLVPAGAHVNSHTLAALLTYAVDHPDASALGPLILQPARRGSGQLVHAWGRSVSRSGLPIDHVEAGELHQGQLPVREALAVPLDGMLVRADLYARLGGLAKAVPDEFAALEFGWLINLAGGQILVVPDAELELDRVDDPDVKAAARARFAGLSLVTAYRPGSRWLLLLLSALRALGLLMGKDLDGSRAEIGGLAAWLTHPGLGMRMARRRRSVDATAQSQARTRGLLPPTWHWLVQAVDQTMARFVEWIDGFSSRGDQSNGFDVLIGGDFAANWRRIRRKASPVLIGLGVMAVLCLVATRSVWGIGQLYGGQLLPAPTSWTSLLGAALSSLPDQPGTAGPPWLGLLAVLSFVTAGQPEWLVTLIVVLVVPATWLGAERFARQLFTDYRVAFAAATLYALTPTLMGLTSRGAVFDALWAMVLPYLAYGVMRWMRNPAPRVRDLGAVVAGLTLALALVPLGGLIAIGVIIWLARRDAARRDLAIAVGAVPLLVLGFMWLPTLVRYPGRILTGVDPALVSLNAPNAWGLLVGRTPGAGLPPLWLGILFFAVIWLLGFVGAWLRPGVATWAACAGAGVSYTVAIVVSHLVVRVPPGLDARPAAQPWLILMVAALLLAAGWGTEGTARELSEQSVGRGQFIVAGVSLAVALVIAVAAGWWALDGMSGVSRSRVGNLPPFVRNAMTSGSVRVMALQGGADTVGWVVLNGDYPRLGDAERSLGLASSPDLGPLAESVAARLIAGTADVALVGDLQRLGVGYVWLRDGDETLRTGISNTPGIGTGTGDEKGWVWPVPGASATPLSSDPAPWSSIGLLGFVVILVWAAPGVRPRTRDGERPRTRGGARRAAGEAS